MYAKIVLFAKLPRKFEYFDYAVPQELKREIKTGHIVAVYFHGRQIYGLVAKLEDHSNIEAAKLKPILSITNIVIPRYLIDLVSWVSQYYLVSPSLLYKLFIPKETKFNKNLFQYSTKDLVLNKEEAGNVISALAKFISPKNTFFLYDNNPKETCAVMIKLAEKELQNKKQVLILAPTATDMDEIAPYLHSIFKNHLIIFKGKLSAGEKYSIWQKLKENEPAVILGTRPACFLPLKNLSLICFLNSGSQDHKQWDMNPRYDAKKIAEKLQELLGVKIVYSDILPDLQIFKELSEGGVMALNDPVSPPSFSLVDIQQEKNTISPLFSYPLFEMIRESEGKKNILFLNRRKDSMLICNDCRYIFLCPSCGRPFYLDPVRSSIKKSDNRGGPLQFNIGASNGVDKNLFLCYHCKVEKAIATACPKCNGTRLKPIALGANTIKKIINAEFPHKKIEISGKAQEIIDDNFDILITTDYFWRNILPRLSGQKIYGAAMLDFDFYLNRPEFNQSEIAIAALHRFFGFAKNFYANKIIIQTSCPENIIWSGWQNFYKKELEEREALNYPPFKRLIKIICKERDILQLEENVKKLYDNLIVAGFHALPPFAPYHKKRTKNFIKHIILKVDKDVGFADLAHFISDKYQVDVDPVSIY